MNAAGNARKATAATKPPPNLGIALADPCGDFEQATNFSPQGLGLGAVLRPALGLVGPGAAGEAAVGGVVAGDVSDAVAAGSRALDQLLAVLAPPVDATEGHGTTGILHRKRTSMLSDGYGGCYAMLDEDST